jgi:GntR family transcriptional regulator/MocR family aminotransferase
VIPFKSIIVVDKDSGTAVYQQIANGIIQRIRQGHLRRGLKLPGARALAAAFGVHRKTLQMALDELVAQGWLEIEPRKGTFVAKALPELNPSKFSTQQPPDKYPAKTLYSIKKEDFGYYPTTDFQHDRNLIIAEGFPDIRLAPMRELMREMRSIERNKHLRKYYHYGNPQGSTYLREPLSSFLSDTRGLPITAENMIITNGAQMGLYLTANLLLKPGDHAVVGEPGYHTATLTLARTGATINKVNVDAFGIDVDAIERLCKKRKIRLVYVIPHHHHPTTVTLTPERRIRLLNLASKYKFAIVEDDYDYDFHYTSSPMLPMASLDKDGSVIYIGTLSKTIVPAIRIGFIVAPKTFIEAATQYRRSIEFHGDTLMEVSIAELYKNGVIANHIKKSVRIYRERRDNFCQLLKDRLGDHVSFNIPEGGMCVWTKFHTGNLTKITAEAARKGLTMSDGSAYNKVEKHHATRLGFSPLNFNEQEKALDILKSVVCK